MTLHPSEAAFLSALAVARDSWVTAAASAVSNPSSAETWSEVTVAWSRLADRLNSPEDKEAFVAAVREVLSGLVHSSLVTVDGGSVLAETTLLTVQDDSGYVFKTFLHEAWPQFGSDNENEA